MNEPHDPNVTADLPAVPVASCAAGLTATFASTPEGDGGTAEYVSGRGTEPTCPDLERAAATVSVPGYEIEGVLGRGGMGIVYKARHLALKRTVALKMVLAGGHAGPGELARFRIEAEAVARLSHPNIVQIHEVGEAHGHPFCALEFVEGGNLASKLKGQPMPAREAAKLVEALARAMQLAHSRNVVHRDLKPANILLSGEWRASTAEATTARAPRQPPRALVPKITDFGLARHLDSDSGETHAGAVMGTPSYMAPEQASGRAHEAGPAADVYALGAILYACLTSQPPFKGTTVVETLDQVRMQEPTPPSRRQANVPLDLETICLKCLRKEPEQRYASAAELADELVRFQQGEPILARPVGRIERFWKWTKRHPARAAFSGALVLLLVTVAGAVALLAVTERKAARDQAEYNQDLLRERGEKDQALRNERVGSARLALDRGLILCEQGDIARGLVAMAAGLAPAVEAEADAVESAIRHNLAAWEREMWPLQSIYQGPPGTHVVAARIRPGGDVMALGFANHGVELLPWGEHAPSERTSLPHDALVQNLEFSADGRRLLTQTRSSAHLWDCSAGVRIGAPLAGEPTIEAAAISPDGAYVAIAGNRPVVRLWDVAAPERTLQELRQTWPARLTHFRPDGRELLTSENDNLRRWDVRTGAPLGPPLKHDGMVVSAKYSRDGKWIVSCTRVSPKSGNAVVSLWDALAGKLQFESAMEGGTHPEVFFSPNGQTYAALSMEGEMQLRWTATGERVPIRPEAMGAISSISFSPDSSTLILGERNGRLRFWDIAGGNARGPILYHQGAVSFCDFSADGKKFVSLDGALRRWQVAAGTRRGRALTHSGSVYSLGFSPDGRMLLTGGAHGAAKAWSTETGKCLAELKEQTGDVLVVAFAPKGNRALTAGLDATARLWDTADWRVTARLTGHTGGLLAAAISPNSEFALTGGSDRTARLWDIATGRQMGAALDHSGPIRAVAIRPDGRVALCGCQDGKARLWRVATQEPIGESLSHPQQIEWVGFTSDGRLAITAGFDREVRLWESDTGRRVGSVPAPNSLSQSVATSRDGRFILSGGWSPVIQLRTLATAESVGLPLQHLDVVRAVAFAPDGNTVLTGSFDATARRWHVPTGFPIGPALRHQQKLRVVDFSPTGRLCATGGWDGAASIWETPAPTEGDALTVRLRAELFSGVFLGDDGSVRALGFDGWSSRHASILNLADK